MAESARGTGNSDFFSVASGAGDAEGAVDDLGDADAFGDDVGFAEAVGDGEIFGDAEVFGDADAAVLGAAEGLADGAAAANELNAITAAKIIDARRCFFI